MEDQQQKRLKVAEEEKPSLLLRMGATQQPQQRRSPAGGGGRSRQGHKTKSPSALPTPTAGTPDLPPVGISIKGAARSRPHPHSLLERIQGEGT